MGVVLAGWFLVTATFGHLVLGREIGRLLWKRVILPRIRRRERREYMREYRKYKARKRMPVLRECV